MLGSLSIVRASLILDVVALNAAESFPPPGLDAVNAQYVYRGPGRHYARSTHPGPFSGLDPPLTSGSPTAPSGIVTLHPCSMFRRARLAAKIRPYTLHKGTECSATIHRIVLPLRAIGGSYWLKRTFLSCRRTRMIMKPPLASSLF